MISHTDHYTNTHIVLYLHTGTFSGKQQQLVQPVTAVIHHVYLFTNTQGEAMEEEKEEAEASREVE